MNLSQNPEITQELRKEGLFYCSDDNAGFFRQPRLDRGKSSGKSFKYYGIDGKTITDKKTLNRIKSLAIPPAWENVWICPKENGHLQATGIDDRNRKQYIYHPNWISLSSQNKFSKMVDFGLKLPNIRSKVKYDLQSKNLDKRKILATVIWLLEHTFIRIGNAEYASENNSFGLTTLRNKHVEKKGSDIVFRFRGKSGIQHEIEVSNPTVVKTIKRCIELPGYELFKFIDEDGEKHVVDSADVNQFLKDITQDDFSAKDFRTWGATSISANNFYTLGIPENRTSLKKNIIETVKKVANHLNNTVSVCRNYYIHPSVFQTYQENILVPHFGSYKNAKRPGLSWDEYALIKLLQKYPYESI